MINLLTILFLLGVPIICSAHAVIESKTFKELVTHGIISAVIILSAAWIG